MELTIFIEITALLVAMFGVVWKVNYVAAQLDGRMNNVGPR